MKTAPIIFALSFCSIIYELLLAKALTSIIDESILCYSFTIGFYVMALGIGTYLTDKRKASWIGLCQIEFLLAVVGVLSAYMILFFHIFYKIYIYQAASYDLYIFLGMTQTITIVIGILSGFEIPYLIALSKRKVSYVLGVNYMGTLAGTLVFTFIFMAFLNSTQTAILVGSINGILAFYILIRLVKVSNSLRVSAGIGFTLFVLAFIGLDSTLTQFHMKNMYYNDPIFKRPLGLLQLSEHFKDKPRIETWTSPYQKIDQVIEDGSNAVGGVSFFINGHFQFNTESYHLYHESFTHIPIQINGKAPKEVLILGGGDGFLAQEILLYKESLKSITQVDIDPVMVELAKRHKEISIANGQSFSSNKIKLVIDDAFHFVRTSSKKFDYVFIDIPYPSNYDLIKLYSVEFYRMVRNRIKEDGILVLDLPVIRGLNDLKDIYFNTIIRNSLRKAGLTHIFGFGTGDAFLVASLFPLNLKFKYQDFGINLKELTQEQILNIGSNIMIFDKNVSTLNSVFRPTLLRLGDSGY